MVNIILSVAIPYKYIVQSEILISKPHYFKISLIFNRSLHYFLAVNSIRQWFKFAESIAWSRKKFVRFSLLGKNLEQF